jgi:MoaA/NifB/PqqE/SkfB family radical SAM enzyme
MPRELLIKFMTEIREIPTARVVVFTGGEATLRKELLLEGITMAKEGGYITRVVTNGGWATTPEAARRMVQDLKKAGLDELNSSYDDFHSPFTPISNIVNLVRAGLEAEMRIGLGVIVTKDGTWNAEAVRKAVSEGLGMPIEDVEKRVAILEDYPTPSGSGENLDVEGLDAGAKLDIGCPEVIKTVSLHPNGTVKACCGHVMFYSHDLTLGNVKEERLLDIVSRAQHNLLYWWIHMLGPKRILEKLGVQGNYTSICHACQVLTTQHRKEMLEYISTHREEVMVDDVIFGDMLKGFSLLAIQKKEKILKRTALFNETKDEILKRRVPLNEKKDEIPEHTAGV